MGEVPQELDQSWHEVREILGLVVGRENHGHAHTAGRSVPRHGQQSSVGPTRVQGPLGRDWLRGPGLLFAA